MGKDRPRVDQAYRDAQRFYSHELRNATEDQANLEESLRVNQALLNHDYAALDPRVQPAQNPEAVESLRLQKKGVVGSRPVTQADLNRASEQAQEDKE